MKSIYKTLSLGLLMMLSLPAFAQFTFSLTPFVAYSGETKFMGGAFSFAKYNLDQAIPEEQSRQISLLSNVLYSQKRQFMLALIPDYYSPGRGINTYSNLYFAKWPDTFYGAGNYTDADINETYTSIIYSAETTFSKETDSGFQFALEASQGYHKLSKTIEDGFLESTPLVGKESSMISGIGYSIGFDNTSGQKQYPTKGVKLSYKYLRFMEEIGSDFEYNTHHVDTRGYLPIGNKIVLAMQNDLAIGDNDMPFYEYWELGNRLRAYDSKRFIDKVRIASRAESRVFPFSGSFSEKVGFVIFAETGQVSPEVKEISFEDWHWSVGGGLRFTILPEEKLNLRMDFGVGDDSVNFMVNAREVF